MVKSSPWMDWISLIFSVVIVGVAVWWLSVSGAFSAPLTGTKTLSWHFVRSMGMMAYILATGSMIWGLFISSKVVKDWSPGVISMLMHATLSWLAIVFAMGHGLLLLADRFYTYHLQDILVPFSGPYRPFAAGLGIISFWIMLAVTVSFSVRRQMGNRAWRLLHLSSYLAFGLATLHGLMAGTDAHLLGFRVLMGTSVLAVVVLLIYRLFKESNNTPARRSARLERAG